MLLKVSEKSSDCEMDAGPLSGNALMVRFATDRDDGASIREYDSGFKAKE